MSKHFKSLGVLYGSGKSGRLQRSLGFGNRKSDTGHDIENSASIEGSGAAESHKEPVVTSEGFGDRLSPGDLAQATESQEYLVESDDEDIDRDLYAHEMMSPIRAAAAREQARGNLTSPSQQFGHRASISATNAPDFSQKAPIGTDTTASNTALSYVRKKSRQTERDVKRMLMMNGYPILYVILWIPGMTNRILEASGSNTTSRVLAVLQCSTQYIGFANSVTYGLSGIWRKGR